MTDPQANGNESHIVAVPRTCKVCRSGFTAPGTNLTGRVVCFVTVCDRCTDLELQKKVQRAREVRDAARLKRFEGICDPYYRSAAIREAMPLQKAKEIRDHVSAGRGVLACGATGQYKTTCVFNGAVRFLVMRGETVEVVTAAQFRQRTSKASKETDVERYIARLADVPWLFIDDLGNAAVGETGTEALQALLESRIKKGGRPVLVTTQYDPDALATRFSRAESGAAIVRRIRLLTSTVQFP